MNQNEKIHQMIFRQLSDIQKLMQKTEKSLRKAPKGSLVVSKSNGVIQYFHKIDPAQKKGTYIEKANKKLIAALAQKDYDSSFYKEIQKQEKKLRRVLKNLPGNELEEVYLKQSDARKKYVNPHILTDKEFADNWRNVEYTGKVYRQELPKYITENGEKVRSKSEKIIADKLLAMGIPYRYEYPVQIKGYGTVYPDFMVLKMSTREEFYIEHFGKMDDAEYCEKALLKLRTLSENGIVLGKNLLITLETLNCPLDMKMVEEMLKMLL